MKTKMIVLAVAALFVIAGCSTTHPTVKQAQQAEKAAQKQVKNVVSDVPKWFLAPPQSTPEVVFVTGTSSSGNLSMSRDKAVLDAQRQLGDQLDGLVSSMTKSYMRDTGVGGTVTTIEDTEQVTKKLVAEANVAGYKIEEIIVQPEGRSFRSYVMLSYTVGELNTVRAMQEQNKLLRALPAQRQKAFDELDAEVNRIQAAE